MDVNTIGDTTVCAGERVPLQATGGHQYAWNTNSYLSDQNIPNPIATPEQPHPVYCDEATIRRDVKRKIRLTS